MSESKEGDVESSGKLRTRDVADAHLTAGARKVLLSVPGKDVDATIVLGVNDDAYDPATHDIVSNASCTTNCVAPTVSVLHRAFGIERGLMTTIHSFTNDQVLLDSKHRHRHHLPEHELSDRLGRRGRWQPGDSGVHARR